MKLHATKQRSADISLATNSNLIRTMQSCLFARLFPLNTYYETLSFTLVRAALSVAAGERNHKAQYRGKASMQVFSTKYTVISCLNNKNPSFLHEYMSINELIHNFIQYH